MYNGFISSAKVLAVLMKPLLLEMGDKLIQSI